MATTRSGTTNAVIVTVANNFDVCWPAPASMLSADEVEAHVNQTELANLTYYGYGVSSFALSLIETAIELTDGRIAGADLRE